ncbi:beta-ketoacyl-[acyl-carrier-protein] synthase II, partial [bacterium]|nr:beta-ketoacyl-[acyl-carrier-protein] synthase II [bacterium]
TLFNDPTEVKALKNALGKHVEKIPVSAPKSQLGHLLGASSSIEAIAGIMGGLNGVVTPTLNLDNPDPKCDLDHVPNKAREHKYRTFLNNSFGFGGHNCVLAIRTGDPQD